MEPSSLMDHRQTASMMKRGAAFKQCVAMMDDSGEWFDLVSIHQASPINLSEFGSTAAIRMIGKR